MRQAVLTGFFGVACLLTLLSFLFCSTVRTTTNTRSSSATTEKQQIVFFKTHKSGSTTLGNIIFRWAVRAQLRIFCATDHIIDTNRNAHALLLKHYDITLHHIEPGGVEFLDKLIPDATWITVFRQPISRYLSSFYYFIKPDRNVTLEEVVTEPSDLYGLQSDFGLRTQTDLLRFFDLQWKRFKVIVIKERWDESMVMLKTKMGWRWRDVLYISRNNCSEGVRFDQKRILCPPSSLSIPADLRLKIQQKLSFEQILYDKAVQELERYMHSSTSFLDDLTYYRSLLQSVSNNCTTAAESSVTEELCAEYFLDDLDYESLTCKAQGDVPLYIAGASALIDAKKKRTSAALPQHTQTTPVTM